jgi:glycine oxidase
VIECGHRYLVPREDGRVLIGSTEERVGFDKRTTAEGVEGLLAFGCALVPELRLAVREQEWAGLRPHAVTGRPFIGAVPGQQGLYVATGHFRSGLHLSPATAETMHNIILASMSGGAA